MAVLVVAPQVSVKIEALEMFTLPTVEPLTPLVGETVSGLKPAGPEIVQVAGGLVTL